MTTVVVLDDHDLFGAAMVRLLTRAGYDATHCLTVQEAMAALERSPIDLVLVDVNLGEGLNGCLVATAIARRWPRVRTAAMSGYSQADYPSECPDALPFIEKPVSYDDFTARLRTILTAPPYSPSPEPPP